MALAVQAKFYQNGPGEALYAQTKNQYTGNEDAALVSGDGFGVKATSAAPTNVSDFATHVFESFDDALEECTLDEAYVYRPGATRVRLKVGTGLKKRITLDANWAAGHYAFAYISGADGIILKSSAPYHIR